MGVFDGEKYQTAAEKALQFIKNQLDINHFDYGIHWGDEYSDWYEGDVMWGSVTGFSGSESQIEPQYISTSRFYGYDYTGQVSGSWHNVSSPSDAGVNIYVFRDIGYEVVTCPLQSGGSWIAEWEYKEVYKVIDPETGEEYEEEVYYTLPVEVREGIKEFRLGYGLSSHWELISSTEDMKAYRKAYSLSREESPENGGYAYGYLTDYSVRVFAYADTEYMLEDCKIWNCGSGGYIWFTNHVTQFCGIAADFDGYTFDSASGHGSSSFPLERVKIRLRGYFLVFTVIILTFTEHICDQTDREQVEIPYRNPELHTSEHKERGGHFPLSFPAFFRFCTSVSTFKPHSSMICGST